jgi:hypothetical protein
MNVDLLNLHFGRFALLSPTPHPYRGGGGAKQMLNLAQPRVGQVEQQSCPFGPLRVTVTLTSPLASKVQGLEREGMELVVFLAHVYSNEI